MSVLPCHIQSTCLLRESPNQLNVFTATLSPGRQHRIASTLLDFSGYRCLNVPDSSVKVGHTSLTQMGPEKENMTGKELNMMPNVTKRDGEKKRNDMGR